MSRNAVSIFNASLALAVASTLCSCSLMPWGGSKSPKNEEAENSTPPPRPAAVAPSAPKSAAGTTTATTGLPILPTDPGYRLTIDDHISINVYGEPELSIAQRIDSKGFVRIPLAGEINLVSKSVREAENFLEKTLTGKKILREPMVNISIVEYAPREVSVLGGVGAPGKFRFPKEDTNMEIVDVITGVGGFSPVAKSDEVQVTRFESDGREVVHKVNVESMITGRGSSSRNPKSFLVYPGDRIYVPLRLF